MTFWTLNTSLNFDQVENVALIKRNRAKSEEYDI